MAKKNQNPFNFDLSATLARVISIVEEAGQIAKEIYESKDYRTVSKQDGSPFTIADEMANQIIQDGLSKLDPNFPIISEESPTAPFAERSTWQHFWLVDPIDGTKEFIKGTGDFTVNVALVYESQPIMGVVCAPIYNELFFAATGQGAYQKKDDLTLIEMKPMDSNHDQLRCFVSNSAKEVHLNKIRSEIPGVKITAMGSSRKICHLAKGRADFYLRKFPTSEWDTAAAHCILAEAGGQMIDLSGKVLKYNKEKLTNPNFIAFGDPYFDWENLLKLTKE